MDIRDINIATSCNQRVGDVKEAFVAGAVEGSAARRHPKPSNIANPLGDIDICPCRDQ